MSYSHKKCYANTYGECSKTISKEHYISANILLQLTKDKKIAIKGHSRIPNSNKSLVSVGISNLTSNILCSKHNSDLSLLDAEIGKLYAALKDCDKKEDNLNIKIDGFLIERWLLKFAFGIISSGHNNHIIINSNYLDVLFGFKKLPRHFGLYILPLKQYSSSIDFRLDYHPTLNQLLRVECNIGMIQLNLILGILEKGHQYGTFRPRGLIFQDQLYSKCITLFNNYKQDINLTKVGTTKQELHDHQVKFLTD